MSPSEEAHGFPRPFGSKYMLLRHLATGGMADVFLARQTGSAGFMKEIVIKRILPHLARDQQFVTMFLDEARLCARLNHPNIAQVFDLGQVGQDYFIAMEHIDGVDLEQLLEVVLERGEGRVPPAIAARVVAAAADGLQHAHNAVDTHGRPLGIVHRDVTPSNVMVSFDGVPKILDFGIAKATHKQAKTEVGIVRGKAPYMSPEQVEGELLDGRSDLFSLGCILYELITGIKPFVAETAHMVGVKILHDDPTPPSLQVDDVPEKLENVVLWALAKRTGDRIPSALVFHQELEKFLLTTGTPSTAHDVAAYLATRFPRDRSLSLVVGAGGTPVPPSTHAPTTDERRIGYNDTLIQATVIHDTIINATPTVPHAGTTTPRRTPAAAPSLARPNETIGEAIARIRAATNPQLAAIPANTPPTGLAMNQRPQRPTGHLTLGEVPEEPANYKPPRSLGGGGGKWMLIVIAGLVLATGVSLFMLRGYELRKNANAETAPEKIGATVTPPTTPETKPEAVKAGDPVKAVDPSAPPEVKPTTPETKPATTTTATDTEPKVTPLPEKAEKTEKSSSSTKKKHHHHSSSSSSKSSPTERTLPRLPTPPPEN